MSTIEIRELMESLAFLSEGTTKHPISVGVGASDMKLALVNTDGNWSVDVIDADGMYAEEDLESELSGFKSSAGNDMAKAMGEFTQWWNTTLTQAGTSQLSYAEFTNELDKKRAEKGGADYGKEFSFSNQSTLKTQTEPWFELPENNKVIEILKKLVNNSATSAMATKILRQVKNREKYTDTLFFQVGGETYGFYKKTVGPAHKIDIGKAPQLPPGIGGDGWRIAKPSGSYDGGHGNPEMQQHIMDYFT